MFFRYVVFVSCAFLYFSFLLNVSFSSNTLVGVVFVLNFLFTFYSFSYFNNTLLSSFIRFRVLPTQSIQRIQYNERGLQGCTCARANRPDRVTSAKITLLWSRLPCCLYDDTIIMIVNLINIIFQLMCIHILSHY